MRKELLLSDLIDEISMGPFGSDIKVDNFIEYGVPVLNGSNLTNRRLVEHSFNYISKEKADSLKKANAYRGDMIITHRGTLGQVSYIPDNSQYERYVISQSQFRVRFNNAVNPIYLTYLFHTDYGQRKLLSFKNHVGVPALAQATSNFKLLELALHDRDEQDRIANLLSSLDDKIELNKKINTQLERVIKAIYDYWFVQFDFPDENGLPYKSSGGKMIYNDKLKRLVPIGWSVEMLSNLTSVLVRGLSPKYTEVNGIPVINQKCIRNKTIDFAFARKHDNSSKNVFSKVIAVGDILVNSTGVGTLGRIAIVKRLEEPIVTADSHVTIVRIDEKKANPLYIGYAITERQDDIEMLGEGSTGQTELSRKALGDLKLLVPNHSLQVAFENLLRPIFEKMAVSERENAQLNTLRDWLLPMLMNGQITINTARERVSLVLVVDESLKTIKY